MSTRRVAMVTGTRAEFGLLRPVMDAVREHQGLDLKVVVTGTHLLPPDETAREVAEQYRIDATVVMQQPGSTGRIADARALGRGIAGCANAFEAIEPDWVVVLGDRIEALAGASAASVGGIGVAHLHGGDRAPGVADDAMRHAITKLAHLHLPATERSAERIRRLGEQPERVHVVGSPALDALARIEPLDDASFERLGSPQTVFLMHPIGRTDDAEATAASALLSAIDGPCVALLPNHDPGRDGIVRAIEQHAGVTVASHLPREVFVGLLRRVALLAGNSSAGLIEAAALGCASVDVGARQSGRERCPNVVTCESEDIGAIRDAIASARASAPDPDEHPYGDGHAGQRIAQLLSATDPGSLLRKQIAY